MIRLGLIGCGALARAAHAPSIAQIPDAEVVAYKESDL